jgi:uncharacterized protein YciI
MKRYAVIREAGPGWADGRGTFEQPAVDEHSAFMEALAGDGFVVCAGPLAGSEHGRIRALVIVEADDETEVHRRLADDPWTLSGQLVVASAEPWNVIVGAGALDGSERLGRGHPGRADGG